MEQKPSGLTLAEVNQRKAEGKVNISANLKTKSVSGIFYDNICTLFNAVNVVLLVALILVGSYKNTLFFGVVLANTAIGIFQEIRSKISVDRLSILSEKKLRVLRDGEEREIGREEIVLNDILILTRGAQVPADCVVRSGECKVNESLLTGESDLISKAAGDRLLSGSFISSGRCLAEAAAVGADCYAARLNNEAKYIKKVNSQILRSFNFIIKLCTFILFPIGICFFVRQFGVEGGDLESTVVSTVAALSGMIPKGMVLLTSSVLAVSVVRLSRKKVLVQDMYCIESLARVDVLCLDKTGTLTADEMTVTDIVPLVADRTREEIASALASVAASTDEINATLSAVRDYTAGADIVGAIKTYPFSSETKWSGGKFENGRTYIMGAAEFVLPDRENRAEVFSKLGSFGGAVRVITLAECSNEDFGGAPDGKLEPVAFVLIRDRLRSNVGETLNYFKEQGVAMKVISGDSVRTVRSVAEAVGIDGAENAVDMSEITDEEQLERLVEEYSVFGRVTPEQKKSLVAALKKNGHSVAMTGDGVNDVPALKEADCSVAMAQGSDAARNVSQIVLVNNDFGSMPSVVAEGRRTINNLERSSSLYLVKTVYSVMLSVFFIFFDMSYPFEPIQLSFIGVFTVAIPSFVLALQPNKNRIKGNFTLNIISRALPAAVCIVLNIIIIAVFSDMFAISDEEFSTISVMLTALTELLLVIRLSVPLNALRIAMLSVCTVCVVVCYAFFTGFFSLEHLSFYGAVTFLAFAVVTAALFGLLCKLTERVVGAVEKRSGK